MSVTYQTSERGSCIVNKTRALSPCLTSKGVKFMDTLPRLLIKILAFFCAVFSVFAILAGNMTSAPDSGFGKLSKGENLNDVHQIMQNTTGEIYTLGQTCVQKFDKSGKFVGGAYYDSNSLKQVYNCKFLSLNKDKVVVLNSQKNIIYFFNDNFDIVETIETIPSYDENDFYVDYPNTDASKKNIRLSFFSNTVLSDNEKIQLDAPRNRLFSREIGFMGLLLSIILIGGRRLFVSSPD